ANNQFEPAEWPAEFGQLRGWIQDTSTDIVKMPRAIIRFHQRENLRRSQGIGPGPFPGRRLFGPDGVIALVDMNAMAVVRPQIRHASTSQKPLGGNRPAPVVDWIVIQLDPKVFQDHILPELAERHFSGSQGLDYQVAVVSGPGSVVFSTDPGFGKQG